MTDNTTNLPAIIRLPEVLRMVGLSRPSVYRLVKAGAFPQQVKLSTAAVGWLRSEVERWIAEKVKARRSSMPEVGLEPLAA
jgi:prophage regulatory protein